MNTLTVVEISHPVIKGNDLIYHYKLIEGTMPKLLAYILAIGEAAALPQTCNQFL